MGAIDFASLVARRKAERAKRTVLPESLGEGTEYAEDGGR